MRKLGFILPLVIASVVVFGAEPEKKAAPAEPKKAEVKAPAKKAEEKKVAAPAKVEAKADAPIATPIPWFVPAKAQELESETTFKVPAEGIRTKATMAPGEARSFILKENAGGAWIINAVNPQVATVKPIAKDDGGWFCNPSVTFEITAVHAGRTLLEMTQVDNRNAPLRAFRCYIEVK